MLNSKSSSLVKQRAKPSSEQAFCREPIPLAHNELEQAGMSLVTGAEQEELTLCFQAGWPIELRACEVDSKAAALLTYGEPGGSEQLQLIVVGSGGGAAQDVKSQADPVSAIERLARKEWSSQQFIETLIGELPAKGFSVQSLRDLSSGSFYANEFFDGSAFTAKRENGVVTIDAQFTETSGVLRYQVHDPRGVIRREQLIDHLDRWAAAHDPLERHGAPRFANWLVRKLEQDGFKVGTELPKGAHMVDHMSEVVDFSSRDDCNACHLRFPAQIAAGFGQIDQELARRELRVSSSIRVKRTPRMIRRALWRLLKQGKLANHPLAKQWVDIRFKAAQLGYYRFARRINFEYRSGIHAYNDSLIMHGDWTQLFLFVASDKPTFFAAGEDVPDCTEDAGGGKHQTLYRKPIAHPFGYHFFRGNYIKRDGQMKPSTVPAALHTPPAKLWGKDVQRGVSLMAIQDDYKLSRVEKLLFPLVRWYDLKFIPKLRSLLPKRFRTSALY